MCLVRAPYENSEFQNIETRLLFYKKWLTCPKLKLTLISCFFISKNPLEY